MLIHLTLHTSALLPTFPENRTVPLHRQLFNIFRTNKPHVKFCVIAENQCVPFGSFNSRDHGFHTSLLLLVLV